MKCRFWKSQKWDVWSRKFDDFGAFDVLVQNKAGADLGSLEIGGWARGADAELPHPPGSGEEEGACPGHDNEPATEELSAAGKESRQSGTYSGVEGVDTPFQRNFGGLVLGCIEADFGSQYSFCGIVQDQTLQYLHTCVPLQTQFFLDVILVFSVIFIL